MMGLVIPFVLALMAGSAAAQVPHLACGSAIEMLKHLKETYGEVPLSGGVVSSGKFMVFLLGNPDKGTWTILNILPNDTACLGAAGDGLQLYAEPLPPDEGEPS